MTRLPPRSPLFPYTTLFRSQRLTRREQFEVLRDFGFGTATGVPYPSEANGVLREPVKWSPQSPASLAMGYEISVKIGRASCRERVEVVVGGGNVKKKKVEL